MYCSNCGTKQHSLSKYCYKCGVILDNEKGGTDLRKSRIATKNTILYSTIIIFLILAGLGFLWFQKDFVAKTRINANKTVDTGNELTAKEIQGVSKSVVTINCVDYQEGFGFPRYTIRGSGTYMELPFGSSSSQAGHLGAFQVVDEQGFVDNGRLYPPITDGHVPAVLTNAHVANIYSYKGSQEGTCWIEFPDVEGYQSIRGLLKDNDLAIESFSRNWIIKKEAGLDYALMGLYVRREHIFTALYARIFKYDQCKTVNIGAKIYTFGYPGSAYNTQELTPVLGQTNIIVSEGIISGKAGDNYFTTAKIDAGNSGGIAVTKMNGNICVVGVPTWVAEGDYENLGIIQSIKEIMGSVSAS